MLVRRTFSLDTGRDARLLAWLDAQDNASEAIRSALHAYVDSDRVTLEKVYQALRALETEMGQRQWHRSPETTSTPIQEDPELAAQLDQLGL